MSQYLNIYIKTKRQDKPVFLIEYSRNSNVYGAITDDCHIPFDEDGNTYYNLTVEDIDYAKSQLEREINSTNSRINFRNKVSENVLNKEAVEELIDEIECLTEYRDTVKCTLQEIEHLLWLAKIVEDNKQFEWYDGEKLMANIR